jgi:hypothetical protein
MFFFHLALRQHDRIDVIRDLITEKLPTQNYNVLKYLIEFLNLVRIWYILMLTLRCIEREDKQCHGSYRIEREKDEPL